MVVILTLQVVVFSFQAVVFSLGVGQWWFAFSI